MLKRTLCAMSILFDMLLIISCGNIIGKMENLSFSLGDAAVNEITMAAGPVVKDDSVIKVTCQIKGDNSSVQSQSIKINELANVKFFMEGLQSGRDIQIELKVYLDNKLIYEGLSNEIRIQSGQETHASITLNLHKSKITYTDINGKPFLVEEYTIKDIKPINSGKRPGYKFEGWFYDKECTKAVTEKDFGTNNFVGDVTIYGNWKDCGVGDIALSDGTFVAPEKYTTPETGIVPIAVIFRAKTTGADGKTLPALGVGLKNSDSQLAWATGSNGIDTKYTDVVCTPSVYNKAGASDTATFTGDTNGSDNWSVICGKDSAGTAAGVVATNYPAFDFVNKYAGANNLQGEYALNWYMPSIAELAEIYRNRVTVNSAIEAVRGSVLKNDSYWSSSQSSSQNVNAWILRFNDGALYSGSKTNLRYVCCIRAF